ncbi:MAG TPA: VPLPA-CTERM sorting domain-containing protein [Steroidobacteraceae bacterium]
MSHQKMTRAIALGVASVCAGLLSISANAASTTATAQLFGLTDLAGVLSFSNDFYVVLASTPEHDEMSSGTTAGSYFLNDGNSFAEANGNDGFGPYTHIGVNNNGSATATVMWSFDWTATADGQAAVSADYLREWTVANLQPGEQSGVRSSITLSLDGTPFQSEVLDFFANVSGSQSDFSTLSLLFPVLAGEKGSLTVTLTSTGFASAAPVPLPAAIWLLGSSLLGLGGVARRRKA